MKIRLPKNPHGFIQWKGTDVCMDCYCKCGNHWHVDAEFCYTTECPSCGAIYDCDPIINLILKTN